MNSTVRPDVPRPSRAPAIYSQDGQGYQAVVHAHYFVGNCDWLVTEYDPADQVGFGWACLGGDRQNAELGYVSFEELDELRVPLVAQMNDGSRMQLGHSVVELDADWPGGLTLAEGIALLDTRQGRT